MSDLIEQEPAPVETHSEETQAQPEAKCCASKRSLPWGVVFTLVVLIGVGVFYFFPTKMALFPQETTDSSETTLSARLERLEARTQSVEKALSRLSSLPASQQEIAPVQQGQSPLAGGEDIEKLKAGLVGLSGALSLLQQELEKTSKVTNEDRINTQAGLATIIAFFQMDRLARNGQPFEKDRLVMRKLADNDQVLVDKLISLEPYAVQGVPTALTLYKDWRAHSVEAQVALRKSGAQTWIDRIVVALEGLISIRSVTPGAGESLSFAGISMDLEAGRLEAAVQKAASLPVAVQDTIKVWLEQARARLAVEAILSAINDHLIERGSIVEQTIVPQVDPLIDVPSVPSVGVSTPSVGGTE